MTTPRIAPLEPPFEPDAAESLRQWMPRNSPVPPLALFRTMHRNPKLAAAMHPFGRFNLRDSSIAPRDREIVIHRTCALCHCEYEWGVHVASFAERVGFSAAEIEATVTGAAVWDDREQLLVSLTDALHRTAAVPDELWAGLREHWSENQLLELVALVGWYHVISFVANSAQVKLEDWAPRFPGRQL